MFYKTKKSPCCIGFSVKLNLLLTSVSGNLVSLIAQDIEVGWYIFWSLLTTVFSYIFLHTLYIAMFQTNHVVYTYSWTNSLSIQWKIQRYGWKMWRKSIRSRFNEKTMSALLLNAIKTLAVYEPSRKVLLPWNFSTNFAVPLHPPFVYYLTRWSCLISDHHTFRNPFCNQEFSSRKTHLKELSRNSVMKKVMALNRLQIFFIYFWFNIFMIYKKKFTEHNL